MIQKANKIENAYDVGRTCIERKRYQIQYLFQFSARYLSLSNFAVSSTFCRVPPQKKKKGKIKREKNTSNYCSKGQNMTD